MFWLLRLIVQGLVVLAIAAFARSCDTPTFATVHPVPPATAAVHPTTLKALA